MSTYLNKISMAFILSVFCLEQAIAEQGAIQNPPATLNAEEIAAATLKKCPSAKYPALQYFGINFLGQIPPEKFNITEKSWKQLENEPCSFDENVIRDQFQTDVGLWINTIFVSAKSIGFKVGGKALKEKHVVKLKETQGFLKRWFLLMAYAPMSLFTNDNASAKDPTEPTYQVPAPFPYPLASALSHGQRILIVLQDLPNGKGLDKITFNLLLGGDYQEDPIIEELRSFASHGTHQTPNNKVVEDKLFAGVLGALKGDHHMVNVPLGGVGNKNELGYFIGPEGQSYEANKDTSVSNYQLGHIFIGVDRFKNGMSALLMGVESTAPHKTSPFTTGGKNHNITSGMKDATTNRSATGGSKWANLLGGIAPATYGGMVINVHRTELAKLKKLFDTVLAMSEERQKEIFMTLLSGNAAEGNLYLRSIPELAEIFS